jgi:alkylation response protein AidB-like acyl-CoA dehydrogenase
VPLVETAVIATHILSRTRQTSLLEETIAGTRVIVPAFIPTGRDGDLPTLTANGRGFHLDGACSLVTFGDQCDGLLVLARSRTGETSLVHIELPCEGVHIEGCAALDGGRVARIRFDDVSVSDASVLARGEDADAIVADAIDHATGAICAEALGIASMLHSRTLDYAAQRVQFGQPIAKFQAIQHRFADMFMAIEEARSLTIMATTALGQPRSAGRTVSLAAAKVGVMSRALHIARESIQLHGGIGFTSELPLGDGLKRLKVLNVLLGDEEHHLAVMGNAQQQEAAR